MAIEAEVILAILHNVGETKFRVAKRMVADRKGQQRGPHGKHVCGLQAKLLHRATRPQETCGVPWTALIPNGFGTNCMRAIIHTGSPTGSHHSHPTEHDHTAVCLTLTLTWGRLI